MIKVMTDDDHTYGTKEIFFNVDKINIITTLDDGRTVVAAGYAAVACKESVPEIIRAIQKQRKKRSTK